jgi:hypothetical protein
MAKPARKPKAKAKPPIIMISSTVYNNEDLLDQVYAVLTAFGYEVWSSHSGTMPTFSNVSAYDNCVQAVEKCDLFFGIISPWYGSGEIEEEGISITHKEILTAIKLNKPRWFAAHDHVVFARRILINLGHKKKDDRANLKYNESKELNDLRVIDMYEDATRNDVRPVSARVGNWVQTVISDDAVLRFATGQFNRIRDVEKFLQDHFADTARVLQQVNEKKKS